jgi:hypothetical protein
VCPSPQFVAAIGAAKHIPVVFFSAQGATLVFVINKVSHFVLSGHRTGCTALAASCCRDASSAARDKKGTG